MNAPAPSASGPKAVLNLGHQSLELPILTGSEGEKALDISQLRQATGFVTLDPAFMNTAACESKITFLDGDKGTLKYRGYDIDDLARMSSFVEVSYLLIHGQLPSAGQLKDFEKRIASHHRTEPAVHALIKSFPTTAHPMSVLSAATVALSAVKPALSAPVLKEDQKVEVIAHLMAQLKNIAASFYRVTLKQDFVPSREDLSFTQDFLWMMFSKSVKDAPPSPEVTSALDVLFTLHADHEQNCSTSSVRLVGSSQANIYATIAGGINALWGPLHGGANQAVVEMLEEIAKDGGGYKKFIDKAKDKNDSFKLMGFGHRVYKNFDPRAKIIKQTCDSVLQKLGVKDPLLDIARGLEEAALSDSYFIERKLYPNVDFYSGIIYRALNIPTNMFTVMFALGRLPGWLAQWKEMTSDASTKIGRPRQIYTGEVNRAYVAVNKR